jgi:hypothetical protein
MDGFEETGDAGKPNERVIDDGAEKRRRVETLGRSSLNLVGRV